MGKKKGTKGTTLAWGAFTAQSETVTNWADDDTAFPTLSQSTKYEEPKRTTTEHSAPAAASRDVPAPRENSRFERSEPARRDYGGRDNHERRGGYDRDNNERRDYGGRDNHERRGGYDRDNNRDFVRRDNNREGGGDSYRRNENREGGESFRRRDDRREQPRERREIPTSPPYTAYVGNLPYDITEADLEDFFKSQGLSAHNARLVRDRETERIKGFGYIEFETVEDLTKALEMNDIVFQERNLKIDVATGKQEMKGRSDMEKDWRSAARSQDDLPTRRENFGDREGGRGYRGGDREGGRGSEGGRGFDRRGGSEGRGGFEGRGGLEGRGYVPKEERNPRAEQQADKSSAPKSNPFGAARPRDVVLADRQKQQANQN